MMQWNSVVSNNMLTLTLVVVILGTSRSTASFCGSSNRILTQSHHPKGLVGLSHHPNPPQTTKKKQHSNRCIALKMSTTIEKSRLDAMSPSNPSSLSSTATATTVIQDISTIILHASFCLLTAAVVSFYEGYDCTYLKPQSATIRHFPTTTTTTTTTTSSTAARPTVLDIMNTGTKGMGRGRVDRLDGWYQTTYFGYDETEEEDSSSVMKLNTLTRTNKKWRKLFSTNTVPPTTQDGVSQNQMREIRSYNEIMEDHRLLRVPTWRRDTPSFTTNYKVNNHNKGTASESSSQEQEIQKAITSIYNALATLEQIKIEANDYNWNTMKTLLESKALRVDLLDGCSVLRGAVGVLDSDARRDIGFDWGSCAWRHCGASADAQESLAELYNNAGMLEPFECLFTIDIVERSLRDILAVVPNTYHPVDLSKGLKVYVPYQPISADGYSSNEEDGDSSSSTTIDDKFVSTLSGLRNDYTKSN